MSITETSLDGLLACALVVCAGCGGSASIDQAGADKAATALMNADSLVSRSIQAKFLGGDGNSNGLNVTVTGSSYTVSAPWPAPAVAPWRSLATAPAPPEAPRRH